MANYVEFEWWTNILELSQTNLSFFLNLYPICLTLAFAELITNYLKYKKHLCYVYLSTNFLILAENKQTKLFANEISLIEYRHEILYFVKKDGKSIQIKLEHINQKTIVI